ncbi:MAG: TIGR04552 family protein [Oligoflexia bacterium]|nr:TIGR04552 family protein [Oligoflexia bacterium]
MSVESRWGVDLAHNHEGHQTLMSYIDSLRLNRDVMNLMLRGTSVIDSWHSLPIANLDLATEFLLRYGYDLENPVEAAELLGNYHESLRFIRKYFLKPENPDGADLEIPKAFLELIDIRTLFVWASDRSIEQLEKNRWACSVLRVMHAISHLDKDIRHSYFSEIQKQIFDRFYREIHSANDSVYLGNPSSPDAVLLDKFQTKPRKARDSTVLKILHKKENLAEDVFDQIGVRFITNSRLDVIRVLKYLGDRYIVMPMNIRPSRSRNSLIDPLRYRRSWREVKQSVLKGEFHNREWVDELLEKTLRGGYDEGSKAVQGTNPFSSNSFHSIQFTCRQLIKYRSPVYDDVKSLKQKLKSSDDEEVRKLVDNLDISYLTKEQKFFYPFEVQILEKTDFEEAETGAASHAQYKAAQTKVAMKRVLGPLHK